MNSPAPISTAMAIPPTIDRTRCRPSAGLVPATAFCADAIPIQKSPIPMELPQPCAVGHLDRERRPLFHPERGNASGLIGSSMPLNAREVSGALGRLTCAKTPALPLPHDVGVHDGFLCVVQCRRDQPRYASPASRGAVWRRCRFIFAR